MSGVECRDVRVALLDHQRGRLSPEADAEIHAHVEGCASCQAADAVERALGEVLEQRLPQHPASLGLKRRLAARWSADDEASPRIRRWSRRWRIAAVALAIVLVAATAFLLSRPAAVQPMVAEAVNDHLRGLDGRRPVEVASSEMHQMRPWFGGRLDFAPAVAFAGDAEFPLRGAAVEYFIDRKAAVFVYTRRLHRVSVFVFRADHLPWPRAGFSPLGSARAYATTLRGFNVILWRHDELGYAAVSDLQMSELRQLATLLNP